MDIIKILSGELHARPAQIESAIQLLDDGNTVPFIARYRKEATGGLDDEALRTLEDRLGALRALDARREDVRRLIAEQDKLTDEISRALDAAATLSEIDDIYRPFRPKRRTRASIAAERGLEPLADWLLAQHSAADPAAEAARYVGEEKGVGTPQDALAGAMDILAERISDDAALRGWIRRFSQEKGALVTKAKSDEDSVYRQYYDYTEPLRRIPSHRILAVDRGEKEGFLGVKLEVDAAAVCNYLESKLCKKAPAPATPFVAQAVADAYRRLIAPSIENELRAACTQSAQEQAMAVFRENLKNLLLQPPVAQKTVMGFDPAFRTGCKIAVVNATGGVLDTTVVYPTAPQNKTEEAAKKLTALIDKHGVDVISIGNGTASRESEVFVAGLIGTLSRPVSYVMTNEAGASVYSASKLGSEEFPELDVSLRSAVSIARRLQDPLAELVKIDPKAIGVGQYQHDMNPRRLSESLDGVVENCVSSVGADLNTASVPLLSHIAGINSKIAKSIYDYREGQKVFRSRAELKNVKGLGEKAYTQCAGFLRVTNGGEPLDNTAVHPESYGAARRLLTELGYTADDIKNRRLGDIEAQIAQRGWENVARTVGVGEPTLRDIAHELAKPGRDPREELPQPVLRRDVMDIASLRPGMELVGTVRNVADFGAFVDIGVHQDGLVHISRLSDRFVRRAMDVVSVGDVIRVRVLEVDAAKKRISLERIREPGEK